MTKHEAIRLFGTTSADLARAVGLSRSRISQWEEVLTREQTDRVIGAAVRLGKFIPAADQGEARGAA